MDAKVDAVATITTLIKAYNKAGRKEMVVKLFRLAAYIDNLDKVNTGQLAQSKIQQETIMLVQKIAAAAEAKIIDLTAQLTKVQADATAAAATAQSSITTLNSQIADLNKQLTDLKALPTLDPSDSTEMTKLADLLRLDPTTGLPLA